MSQVNLPKLALITGGSSGIGAAIAAQADREGYQVALMDTNAEGVRAVASKLHDGVALVCDITDEAAVEVALDSLGRTPDLLVNNAGIVRFEYMLDMSVETFRRVMDVDLTGAFIMARAVGRRLRDAQRGGAIVNIASIGGITPSLGTNAYAAAKAGMIKLTELMALEWGPLGIRTNTVSPGFIDGGMSAAIYADPRTREIRTQAVPQRRLGLEQDIAEAVMFLASARAAYVNGHNLVVDGGVIHSVLSQIPRA